MGSSQSKLAAGECSLESLPVEEIGAFVAGLGSKYEGYYKTFVENALDGELLVSLANDREVVETLECLDITNFLHQRVLLKEWKKAIAVYNTARQNENEGIHTGREIETSTTDSDSIHMDDLTAFTLNSASLAPSAALVKTLQALELQENEHGLTAESKELQPYRTIATRAMEDLHGNYGSVNLISLQNEKGHNSLCSVFDPDNSGSIQTTRLHVDGETEISICRPAVLGSNEDFVEVKVPQDASEKHGMKGARYYGHVVRCGSLRVGMVCAVIEESKLKNTSDDEKQVILKLLAMEAERQLERRKVLVQRTQNLKRDIEELKKQAESVDKVVLRGYGPLNPVMASQIDARLELFPYPDDETGIAVRRSAELPFFSGENLATDEERAHLPPTLYDPLKEYPIDRAPVGKHDMERVGLLNSLGLLDMDPTDEEAMSIRSLVNMAGSLLGADFIFVNLIDHQNKNTMFPTIRDKDQPGKDLGKLPTILNATELIKKHADGSPFMVRMARCMAFCNYALTSPRGQSFVVHDVAKDQSYAFHKEVFDVGFCSSSPIIIQGLAVGALCILCKEAKPDFGKAQEIQQEQIAQLIAQQFETWALHREMKKLERERTLLIRSNSSKSLNRPPEDYAALVFTGVQGASAMWEADSAAINKALAMHNQIIRQHVAAHHGYEVDTEGESFHIAFADVVDAVQFCLKVQEALYAAPWEEGILALSDASEDTAGCFRGLRVRMAIHAGDVVSSTSDLSGRTAYGGKTFHIAKSLVNMSHGGQILVTSDVWNISSHLADSILGSPQVIDLGTHVLLTHSNKMHDGITVKGVLQLLPGSLSHDYFVSRRANIKVGQTEEPLPATNSNQQGRTFPPMLSKKCLSASFHDAPYTNNRVAMLFVFAPEVEKLMEDPSVVLAALSKRIGTVLSDNCHLYKGGYQCKDFMLAFADVTDAVRFGLALQTSLEDQRVLDLSLADLVQIGVHEGEFTVMGPHPTTGRADYLGKVVNRAARVANIAAPGSVYLGKEPDLDECNLMPLSNGYMLDFLGVHSLTGAAEELALYKCHACNSWYDKLLSNKSGEENRPRGSLLPRFQF